MKLLGAGRGEEISVCEALAYYSKSCYRKPVGNIITSVFSVTWDYINICSLAVQ